MDLKKTLLATWLTIKWLVKRDQTADFKPPQRIGRYQLIKPVAKTGAVMRYGIGLYKKKDKKNLFLVKTRWGPGNDLAKYLLKREYEMTSLFYRLCQRQIKRHGFSLASPRPITLIETEKSISLVYAYLKGKSLSEYPLKMQIRILAAVLDDLRTLSFSLTPEQIAQFPKRSLWFYLYSLPLFALAAVLFHPEKLQTVFSLCKRAVTELFTLRENPPVIAHRDLLPENMLLCGGRIYLLDCTHMALALPGYDLAYFLESLRDELSAQNLVTKLEVMVSPFMKAYVQLSLLCFEENQTITSQSGAKAYAN